MSVTLSPVGGAGAQFFDNNGNPLSGGKLYTYAAGTTTPVSTYTSAAGSTLHTNPIVLDSAGRVPGSSEIWLTDGVIYKFLLKTSVDVTLATWDNITGVNSNFVNFTAESEYQTATAGQTVFTLTTMTYSPGTGNLTVYVDGVNQYLGTSYVETDGVTVTFTAGLHVGALVKFTTAVETTGNATDASVVTYTPAGTGAVATTVQAKLRETVSVKDFGAVGDGVTDDTAAIQAALDCVPVTPDSYCPSKTSGGAGRVRIYFPAGNYKVTAPLDCSDRDYTQLISDGRATLTATHSSYVIDMTSADHCVIDGLRIYSTTASIGIYINRSACNPFAMFNEFKNMSITLGTSATANVNQGTIGIYNNRGEQNIFENLEIRSDVAYWTQQNYDSNIPPLFSTPNTVIVSNTVCTHIQCNFIANGPQNYAHVIKGAISHEYINCYWSQATINTGSVNYAVYAFGINRCVFSGSAEVVARFMAVSNYCYSNTIDIAMQVGQLDAGGVINLNDIAGTNVFSNGSVSVMATGGTPATGACVFYGGASSQIRGNIVKTIDPIIPITSTGFTTNNITQTETTNNVGVLVKGATASTASGTPVTLFTTAAYSVYDVYAYVLGGSTPFMATATVINDGTGIGILNYDHGVNITLTISGSNVQATQTAGSPNAIQYRYVRYA